MIQNLFWIKKPHLLFNNVSKPMYRQFIPEPVDEDLLKIKAELFAEDEKIKERR